MKLERPLRACTYPGCTELVSAGRCARHQPGQLRPSARALGYDADWERLRKMFLRKNPTCAECDRRGVVQAAEEIHHKIPIAERPDLRLNWYNLEALCKPCHSRETIRSGQPFRR